MCIYIVYYVYSRTVNFTYSLRASGRGRDGHVADEDQQDLRGYSGLRLPRLHRLS